MTLFVLSVSDWYVHIHELASALQAQNPEACKTSYQALFKSLSVRQADSLWQAAAEDLLYRDSSLSLSPKGLPAGLRAAALYDLAELLAWLKRDWQAEVQNLLKMPVPPLEAITSLKAHQKLDGFIKRLKQDAPEDILKFLLTTYKEQGTGILAQYHAFRWLDNNLEGIAHPVQANLQRLFGLESQLKQLNLNTEAFLAGKPAQHTLLYGPRGSGKSTAVRALLSAYGDAGLRLIELHAQDLAALGEVAEMLRQSPFRYLIFVDDLSFEAGDTSYHPLKTMLEGSLTARPENTLIYATSNRRHLVKEQFKDRPDPLDDDVHAWDTQHERLALSDRFGLTITFPSASQQRYVELVKQLASYERLESDDLTARAIRFAEWGNGYSGRTAQQFVDHLKTGLA